MPSRRRTSKENPRKLAKRMSRRWRVVLLRHKGEILGTVEAPDAEAAKAAAAVQFELDEARRSRIIVQELA
jgi:hypothetical protein